LRYRSVRVINAIWGDHFRFAASFLSATLTLPDYVRVARDPGGTITDCGGD
jgi:hypothetical protein